MSFTTMCVTCHECIQHSRFWVPDCDLYLPAVCNHLSWATIFAWPAGWSLYTGFTVEALAVASAFNQFHPYVYGSFTTVKTDHSALKYIQNTNAVGKIARWMLELQNYDSVTNQENLILLLMPFQACLSTRKVLKIRLESLVIPMSWQQIWPLVHFHTWMTTAQKNLIG